MSADIDDVTAGRVAAGLLEASDHAVRALDVGPSRERVLEIERAMEEIQSALDLVHDAVSLALEGDDDDS